MYQTDKSDFGKEKLAAYIDEWARRKDLPVTVKKSTIDGFGYGLFARRDIEVTEEVAKYGGQFVSTPNFKGDYVVEWTDAFLISDAEREQYAKSGLNFTQTYRDAKTVYEIGELGRWANDPHGVDGKLANAIYELHGVSNGQWDVGLNAFLPITEGEEIFVSYGEHYFN